MNYKFFILILFLLLITFIGGPLFSIYIYGSFNDDLLLESELNIGDIFTYVGSCLSFIATVTLGFITYTQTKKANEVSNKLIKKEIIDKYCFIEINGKIEFSSKSNNDTRVTILSAHHKKDHGATILFEPYREEPKKFNEYYIKIYYNDESHSLIKSITLNNALVVQDPSKDGGLFWGGGSDNPIPCQLSCSLDNNVEVNWVNDKEFFIHFKIYSEPDSVFSNMIENNQITCLMYELTLTSIAGVETKILYKIWFRKEAKNKIKVIRYQQNIKDDIKLKE